MASIRITENINVLLGIPTELLAVIISYVTKDRAEIFSVALINKAIYGVLFNNDAIWRSLTRETFRVTDEKFEHFPKVYSYKVLYSILEKFVPKEGFYVLSETFPWGLLFLFHFVKGFFVGELLIPTEVMGIEPEWENQAYILKPIFKCEFTENQLVKGVFNGEKMAENEEEFDVDILELNVTNSDNHNIFVKSLYNAVFGYPYAKHVSLKRTGHCIRIIPSVGGGGNSLLSTTQLNDVGNNINLATYVSNSFRHLLFTNRTNNTSDSYNGDVYLSAFPKPSPATTTLLTAALDEKTNHISVHMIETIFSAFRTSLVEEAKNGNTSNKSNLGLTFAFVDGPKKKLDIDYQRGMLRPGLYVGFYHPSMYGKYCKECVLIEYKKYTFLGKRDEMKGMNDSITWSIIKDEIFNSSTTFRQSDPSNIFDKLQYQILNSGINEIVFMIARKVTGDAHVPSTAITFGALIYPVFDPPKCEKQQLKVVHDRDYTKTKYKVIKEYAGWGTLAYPGFRNPTWSHGQFLQVESNLANDGHRFAFHWGEHDEDEVEATILNWVSLQDDFPWFDK
jgi:hypothetical protein